MCSGHSFVADEGLLDMPDLQEGSQVIAAKARM